MTGGAVVTPLPLAQVNLAGKYNPPTFADVRIVVNAFLISDADGHYLVDTGVGVGNAYVDQQFQPQRADLHALLAGHGLAATDIHTVINSHLHFDHCGNNALFPHATFLIQRDELEVARTTLYTVQEWFDFAGANIEPVDGDQTVSPNIKLVSTPGHTPGHQSVLVQTEDSVTLIAAQASFNAAEYATPEGYPDVQAHEGLASEYTVSLNRLKSLNAHQVYLSHEPHTNEAS